MPRVSLCCAPALAALFASCVGVRVLDPGEPVLLEPGEAFVLGRVRAFEAGRELTPWNADLVEELSLLGEPELKLSLFRVESEERALYPRLEPDGSFAWVLPEGTWLVYRSAQHEPIWHDVLAAFQARAGSATYLGELLLELEVERNADLEVVGCSVVGLDVRSDPDAARDDLERRPHGAELALAERPLVVDPELRELFDDWRRGRAEQVLARLGLELLPR